ncbi:MAG: hypothetical protein J1E64_15015 [Acetatifactor sp.]|nr:hypothetical protein [Acetatifactor sp.]
MGKKELLIILGMLIFAPIIVAIGVSMPILNYIDNSSPWIGFWGSYVGSIFGGVITLIVLKTTIKSNEDILSKTLLADKEKEFEKQKENYCTTVCEKIYRYFK